MHPVFAVIYILRNYLLVIYLVISVSGFFVLLGKKNKIGMAILSVLVIIFSGFLAGNLYDAYLRPYESKAKINVKDVESRVVELYNGEYSPYDFLAQYNTRDGRDFSPPPFPNDIDFNEEYLGDTRFELNRYYSKIVESKDSLTMIYLDSDTSTIFYAVQEYSGDEVAKLAYKQEIETEVSLHSHITPTEFLGLCKEKTEKDYQFIIYPETFSTDAFNLEAGNWKGRGMSIVVQYKNYMIRISESSETDNLMLPKLIQEKKLFDPEYKGLKRIKSLEEWNREMGRGKL